MRRRLKVLACLAASGILTYMPACRGDSRASEAESEQQSAAPAPEGANLPLPEGWLAEYVAQRQAPAELHVPLGERWRFAVPSSPVLTYLCVAVSGQFLFLGYATLDPNEDFAKWQERRKAGSTEPLKMLYTTECRDIASGTVLWSVDGVAGGMTVLPGYLLMTTSGANGLEIAILDINTREVIRRIPYNTDPKVAAQRTTEEIRRLGQLQAQNSSGDFIESRALDVRRRLLPCVFSEGPDPVSLNMAEWKAGNVRVLLDILRTAGDSEYLMQYGALKGDFLFPDPEDMVVACIGHTLVYRSALEERVHWRQICTRGSLGYLLWRPPYIAVFSSPTAVTGYRIENGQPAWMYEFPSYASQGGNSNRLMSLTDGILLLTGPLMGWSEGEYLWPKVSQRPATPKPSDRLWLTKLDPDGHRVFQQELTMKSQRCQCAVSEGFLVLWAENELVCYGPTNETPRTVPPDQKPPLSEEHRRLEMERLHAEYNALPLYSAERGTICVKLGWLHDRSMLDTVLADFQKASGNVRPMYIAMLGSLNDRRAIDALVPLLEDKSGLHETCVALQRLTNLRDVDLPSAQWPQWWKAHRHLYVDANDR